MSPLLCEVGWGKEAAAEKSFSGQLGKAIGGTFGRLGVEMAVELVGRQEAGPCESVDRVEVSGVEACACAWVHHRLGFDKG
jgi:hypothetical protein